jgi:hypothetical protein
MDYVAWGLVAVAGGVVASQIFRKKSIVDVIDVAYDQKGHRLEVTLVNNGSKLYYLEGASIRLIEPVLDAVPRGMMRGSAGGRTNTILLAEKQENTVLKPGERRVMSYDVLYPRTLFDMMSGNVQFSIRGEEMAVKQSNSFGSLELRVKGEDSWRGMVERDEFLHRCGGTTLDRVQQPDYLEVVKQEHQDYLEVLNQYAEEKVEEVPVVEPIGLSFTVADHPLVGVSLNLLMKRIPKTEVKINALREISFDKNITIDIGGKPFGVQRMVGEFGEESKVGNSTLVMVKYKRLYGNFGRYAENDEWIDIDGMRLLKPDSIDGMAVVEDKVRNGLSCSQLPPNEFGGLLVQDE